MPITQVWTETRDGFVTDFSAISPLLHKPAAFMPLANVPFPFRNAHTIKDYTDQSILGWYCFHNDKKYVVFNV